MTLEIETDDESRVNASRLSNYILRAVAGVVGNNKATVLSYKYSEEKKDQEDKYMERKCSEKEGSANPAASNPCKTRTTEILMKLFRENEKLSLGEDIIPVIVKEYIRKDVSVFTEENMEDEIETALRATAFYGRHFICVPRVNICGMLPRKIAVVDMEYVRVDRPGHTFSDSAN
jgi:hypothetical protein